VCENESIVSREKPLAKPDYHLQRAVSSFEPKTPLGRRLWSIRKRIVASGENLLGWEEIEKEIATRRGEAD
jgi:hypothetical protein